MNSNYVYIFHEGIYTIKSLDKNPEIRNMQLDDVKEFTTELLAKEIPFRVVFEEKILFSI